MEYSNQYTYFWDIKLKIIEIQGRTAYGVQLSILLIKIDGK